MTTLDQPRSAEILNSWLTKAQLKANEVTDIINEELKKKFHSEDMCFKYSNFRRWCSDRNISGKSNITGIRVVAIVEYFVNEHLSRLKTRG